MKKVYSFILALLATGGAATAQTVDNAGMETWRSGFAGISPIVPIKAPTSWYGTDSLVISLGEIFSGGGSDFNAQIFKETTLVHSGSASAKVMTRSEDVLGIFPGLLSNAKVLVDMAAISGGGDPMSAVTFTGGTPVTMMITTVNAYVAYTAGKDTSTGMMGGDDAGSMVVQAIATVGGNDSTVGSGFVTINPSTSFVLASANLTYTTMAYPVHTVRILFTSSASFALDSSTLYVDDVSMEGIPNPIAVGNVNEKTISLFPNPANNGVLHFEGADKQYTCVLRSGGM